MLVFSRRKDEQVRIGDDIIITIVRIGGEQMRIGIEAPKGVPVHRGEVYERIQAAKADNQPED